MVTIVRQGRSAATLHTAQCAQGDRCLLAEKGCTDHEIMAITGHRSLSEVQRYTRKARRSVLADSAMAKFKR